MAASARYTLSQFKHRVAVCSMSDIVQADGVMSLARKDVYHCWAKITPMSQTLYSQTGDAIKQSREVRTHKICIRFRHDIDFTQKAWLYEERLQTGGRWFKVLELVEQGEDAQYLEINCRLVERGVEVTKPQSTTPPDAPIGFMPTPDEVKL